MEKPVCFAFVSAEGVRQKPISVSLQHNSQWCLWGKLEQEVERCPWAHLWGQRGWHNVIR